MTPTALDIAVGIVIFLSVVFAFFRGLVKEVFTLAGLFLAGYCSYKGSYLLIPDLEKWLKVPADGCTEKTEKILSLLTPCVASKVIAYGGIFMLVFILMTLLGILISLWLKSSGLGIVDRVLGAGFGFVRGFLLVFLLFIPINYLIPSKDSQDKFPDWAKNSISVPILQKTLVWSNEHFALDKMIEDRGDGIVVKLDKLNPEKFGKEAGKIEDELKEALKKEEREIQKGEPETSAPTPESAPAPVLMPSQPEPAPAPQDQPPGAPAPNAQ